MNNRSTPQNIFYDSDEDVCWGPFSLRELKRDLEKGRNMPTGCRRQTDSFVPFPTESGHDVFPVTLSNHSTGNGSLETNSIRSTKNCHTENITEYIEVIELSSDNEDDSDNNPEYELPEDSGYQKSKFFSTREENSDNNIICLSSSDDECQEQYGGESLQDKNAETPRNHLWNGRETIRRKNMVVNKRPNKQMDYPLDKMEKHITVIDELKTLDIGMQIPKIQIIPTTPIRISNDEVRHSEIHSVSREISDSLDSSGFHTKENTSVLLNIFAIHGLDLDSDDGTEGIIESTPCKTAKAPLLNTCFRDLPRIPRPRNSRSNPNMSNESQNLTCSTVVLKKTPNRNKLVVKKPSLRSLENVVSPVRLYINNSPVAPIKQTYKSTCVKKQCIMIGSIAKRNISTPKKHRNLLGSLPEVFYKPSRLVETKINEQIILPKSLIKFITERIVVKHELRKRINTDKISHSVGEELQIGDSIAYDDENMSMHTTKHGYNL